jgi:hypothetical protein
MRAWPKCGARGGDLFSAPLSAPTGPTAGQYVKNTIREVIGLIPGLGR